MKVKIEHEMLESKTATAVALFDQWIRWCNANGIKARNIASIPELFQVTDEEYKSTWFLDDTKSKL